MIFCIRCEGGGKTMPRWSKSSKVASGVGVLIVLLSGFFLADRLSEQPESVIVAYVDGEPIYAAELQKSMEKERHAVAMYYYHEHGLEETPGFWTSRYEGELPIERLRMKALQSVVRTKQQMMMARSKGLIEDISYPAFLKNLTKENERRKEAVKKNEVIYGPLQYTEEAYFEYVTANLLIQLQSRLEGAEIPLTEPLLKQYYDTIKEKYYKGEDAVRVHKIRISYMGQDGAINLKKKEQAWELMREAQGKLEQGESFAVLAEQLNETKEERSSYGEQVFDRSTAREDQMSGGVLRQEAMKLAAGGTSGIIETNNALYLLYCLNRLPAEAQPFDQVRQDVKNKYMSYRYTELIDKKTREASIEIRQAQFDEVTLP
ncbi:hypothetical protein B1748_14775 [Paenibacillus sp. MY03]|nr:hypothetical protein B1748_14775 [Paenibacillus sp. MY03]